MSHSRFMWRLTRFITWLVRLRRFTTNMTPCNDENQRSRRYQYAGLAKRLKAPDFAGVNQRSLWRSREFILKPEDYWGNVNPIGPRACYDEGKRCAETLFFELLPPSTSPWRSRSCGSSILTDRVCIPNDGRVVSNFIMQALKGAADQHLWRRRPNPILLLCRRPCRRPDLPDEHDRTEPTNIGNPAEIPISELADGS